MYIIRNVFAFIGLLTVVAVGYGVVTYGGLIDGARQLHPQAAQVYSDMGVALLKTGSAAESMVWKVKVKEGVSADDVEETMRFVANEHNIKNVGELPLYQQVEAISGKPYRRVKIFMFCNAMTAAMMMDHEDAFSAFLPCRITLVEDKSGQLWLYALNMDPMIYGGKHLPEELAKEALDVKRIILDIMERGATGTF